MFVSKFLVHFLGKLVTKTAEIGLSEGFATTLAVNKPAPIPTKIETVVPGIYRRVTRVTTLY